MCIIYVCLVSVFLSHPLILSISHFLHPSSYLGVKDHDGVVEVVLLHGVLGAVEEGQRRPRPAGQHTPYYTLANKTQLRVKSVLDDSKIIHVL